MAAWIALWASIAFHLQILLFGSWFGSGLGPEGGEGGHGGAGGDRIEIQVMGPRVAEAATPPLPSPAPATESIAPEPTDEPTKRSTRERSVLTAARSRDRIAAIPELPSTDEPTTEREGPPEPPSTMPSERAAPESAIVSSGTGADHTSGGIASGDPAAAAILGSLGIGGIDVNHQGRQILERSMECDDPIAGEWIAHRYSPDFHDWARMTLHIQREGTTLRGTITARMWSGLSTDRRPPSCLPGGHDYTVRMPARGWLQGERFDFQGDFHRVVRADCPSPLFAYQDDHFSGRIDSSRDEIDAVNNDGGRDVNAPYRFRRTSCTADD